MKNTSDIITSQNNDNIRHLSSKLMFFVNTPVSHFLYKKSERCANKYNIKGLRVKKIEALIKSLPKLQQWYKKPNTVMI